MRYLICLFLFFGFVSCQTRIESPDQCFYHDDGAVKPKVALIPVIDNSREEFPWNLSEEFTEIIRSKLHQTSKFYFTSDFDLIAQNQLATLHINPFLDDLDWVREMISPTEFIVFIELVKHKLTPKSREGGFFSLQMTKAYTLDMGIRVKIVDIRSEHPKVILQELLQESFHIPWRLTSIDYKSSGWNKVAFFMSPMGLAHSHIMKKVTKQIEEYILLSQPIL